MKRETIKILRVEAPIDKRKCEVVNACGMQWVTASVEQRTTIKGNRYAAYSGKGSGVGKA